MYTSNEASMKKIYAQVSVICFFLLFFMHFAFGQDRSNWANKLEAQKVFIQNKGQFKVKEAQGFDSQVQYAYHGGAQNFYFTTSGVVYELTDRKAPKKSEHEEREERERMRKGMTAKQHDKMEEEENRMIVNKDELRTLWIGANPNVKIIAENEATATYSYTFHDKDGELINKSAIPAFQKLIYKDLYPNIDVVYEIYKDGGVKYSVVVRPGGDISLVKLKYSKNAHLQNDGNIKTHSRFGDFTDHAPITFYEDGKASLASAYVLKDNVISFSVENHDAAKTIVIDPWTQTPTFATQWDCVWECDKDAAGNVYIIGGVSPMQLLKYNSAGALQWTYTTPYDTANNDWLGTFATDNVGNSYVTRGSNASMQKINTGGTLVWNQNNPAGGATPEFWSISFNCDQTQLVVGGTGGFVTPYIYNINPGAGNVMNSVQVTGGGGLGQEVRAITACSNGNYYFLTHDSIGYIHQGLTSCLPSGARPFHVNNSYALSYGCDDFRRNNNGIAAIKAFGAYVYTHRGNQVHKRNFYTAAIIGTGAIPGGVFTTSGFGNYVSNTGIDIDSCGNVYCGSTNCVVKYDANLNQIATYPTAFNVYDVNVTAGGNLIAAGSTGTNGSGARTGYIQSFAVGACPAIAVICCDAFICPHAPVCITDPAFNFTAVTPGGVWSGTGITSSTNGTFNPSVAGVGTFTIYYTLPCGTDSTTIVVNSCTAVSLCRNGNPGTLTVSGGTGPYTWQTWDSTGRNCVGGFVIGTSCIGGTWVTTYGWRTFYTGNTLTVTPPVGADTLRVIDNAGTTVTSWNIATLPPCNPCTMIVSPGTTRNVSCFGGANGSAHVTAASGTTPYTYAWTGSASTVDSAFNLGQGTYTVTVHDANGCSGTASFTITQPATAVTAAPVMTQASCGSNNGKIVLHASGGTPAYSYVWSPNVSTTDSALNLGVATYNVTITDSKGCTFATSVSLTAAAGITVSPGATRNVSCFGGNNGSAHVTVSGGTIPYTYAWTGSASTVDSAFNLTQGTYSVTVHDANNCSGTASFTITQPTAVTAAPVMTQATCGNNNGKIVLHASGGTPAYSYVWSPNVSTTDSALNLGVATYNVTITDSKGCTFATSVSVTAAAGITVSPGATRNVSCFGGNNGSAHVTISGGTTPYTYAWTGSASTVDSAFNLTQGTYTVTVHDANNCSGTASFTITQPPAVTAAPVMTQATCGNSNGKIVLHASGGTPVYSYTWSPNVSTTDSALNLGVATYNVTITDSKGCTFPTSVSVTAAAGITVSPGATRNVFCFGGNNGSAHVTVSGGTTPYTYAWTGSASTVDSAFNLTQGTYTVTVHDANNCSGTASFTITQPTAVTAAPVMTQATCGNSNGKIVLHASGGTPAYSYVWSPNVSTTDSALNLGVATYNVTVTDSKGCTFATSVSVTAAAGITVSPGVTRNVSCFGGNNGSAHVTVSGGTIPYTYAWTGSASTVDSAFNLTQGTYTVTVHDANNCSGTASFTITQPTAVNAAPVMTQATCGNSNGKIVLHASGGTPAYSYVWSPNVSTTDSALNLGVATYNVTITDSKGCTFATSVSVTAAAGITVSPGATRNVSCFGGNNGSAHVTVSGGTIPYTYAWTGSASVVDSAFNLIQGTYTVTVHDANNCSGTASFTITQPTALGISNTTVAATCGNNNGRVVFTVTGGTPAYSYLWSPNVSTVDSAINLGVGSYNVTVTDSKGCSITSSATVVSSSGFSVSPGVKTDVSCFGGSNGTAHVIATGGTIPYTYIWSPNVSTNDSAINLIAGTYDVTVHDANNCSGTISFNIAQPAVLGVTKAVTQGSCGNNNGKIVLTVTGGTPAYSYVWSPNISTNDSAVNLGANTYSVTVTDAKGCTVTTSQAITVSPAINVSPGATTNVKCFGGNDGAAHVTVTGGTSPITYTWSPNVSTADSAVNLIAGTYTVTVHDINNCSGTASFTITQPAAALGVTAATTVATCGNNNGKVVLTTTGGTPAYTYTWSPNVSTVDSATNLAQGTYNVTVQDANGCSTTVSANVSPLSGVNVTLGSQQNVTCNGGSNGKIFLNVTGGVTPYTYVWSPAVSVNDSAVGLSANTYSCSVTDNNNCLSTITVTITEPVAMGVTVATTAASCGASNGTATATTTNSTGTLSYLWSAGGSITSVTDTALAAGGYTVTVTDANQCTGVGTGAVSNSGAPTVSITTQVNENCNGGSTGKIVVGTSGGVPPYTFTWSPNVSAIDSAVNLPTGAYTVTVHDATNCIAVMSTTITEPIALSSTMQSVNADCGVSNGSAQVNATGGTGSYTYVWNPNAGTTATVSNVVSGNYAVTVTDSLGCQITDSVTVGVNNGPPAPSITASGPTTFCQGDSVRLTSSAATGNTWSNNATTQSITVYAAGSYTVTQTVNGCASPPSAAVIVTVNPIPAAPAISASGPLAFCAGDSVILTSSYATGNTWSNSATTQSITVYAAGTYTVSAIQGGCPGPVSAPVSVSILSALQPHITASKPAICPGDSVILDATTASATAYLWSTSSTQPTITIHAPGTYQVTVTSNGCTGTDTISIGTMVPLGTFQLPDSVTLCDGDSVTLDATTLNATSYQWAGVTSNAPVVTVKADGVYYVTVSNSCGSLTESSTITFHDCDCRIVMPNAFTPNSDGINDFFEANFACEAKLFQMRIFDRWGEKVFETTDLYGKWDGKYKGVLQEPGVYVYVADFVGMDHNGERTFKLKGSVTLIR
ncbi:MAG: hypothetical protein JWO03_86 [Bacteroidetes bacterium]|nr:hypothetical protein [Bacteroidota bacterium]